MTPAALEEHATLLLGNRWQAPLARLLDKDPRLIRRWVAGDRPVPEWVENALRCELRKVGKRISEILAES